MPKLPPPTLQITLHDENNQQQSLVGKTDLSPVSEEDLKSIAETSASEETGASSQRRPLAGGGHLPTASSAASSSACGSTSISGFAGSGAGGSSGRSSAGSGAAGGSSASGGGSATVASAAVLGTVLRSDLKETGCESVLILLKKDEGQQWGMGIGKRPRGILITSLQPGSSAAEKLAIGDRIMAVNGHEVSTQHSAVTYIRSSGNSVALQVSRPIKPIVTGTSS
ncbi:hypothetical protein niasHT_024534 [Heterodera trifolii]|uniref:PDZ domain-containing protein n=1 Tax=Heterodera trifolii TaxID=157864 RepID=A0ABD2K7C0_9BILA